MAAAAATHANNYANTGYDFSGEQGGYGGGSTGYYPAEQYLHPGNSMINYDPQYYNGGQYLNQQFAYDGVIDYPPHLDASGQMGNHEHHMHHPAPPGSIVNLTVEVKTPNYCFSQSQILNGRVS